jgi:putative acetyltransferase
LWLLFKVFVMTMNWGIRLIKENDNQEVARLIRSVFDEMEIPKVGTAYEDSCLELMYEEYSKPQSAYFIVARGLGIGSVMMEKCLQQAGDFGFKKCYLETMPFMHAAQRLYKKTGFEYLTAPMGDTGHNSCPVWMLKVL